MTTNLPSSPAPPQHTTHSTPSPPHARPSLQRLPASNAPFERSPPSLHARDHAHLATHMNDPASEYSHGLPVPDATAVAADASPPASASPDEHEVERLRSLQLKMLQHQQSARLRTTATANTVAALTNRRVSPIKEEPMGLMSPTLEGAFHSPSPSPSPMPTTLTVSTESTESARTVRGSVPPTPAASHPLRTPSYPFPTVPSTPRWASSFHLPFTSLSPTVSYVHPKEYSIPKDHIASETSTPVASATPFAPGAGHHYSPEIEDPRFPSPNMYDLVLRLAAEPGLTAWWSTVTSIMQEHYGADRATLAVPADTSDIENVPWGQKTSFTATERDEYLGESSMDRQREPQASQADGLQDLNMYDIPPIPAIPAKRPKLFTHHSFAGHERQKHTHLPESPISVSSPRPRGPLRTTSHAPQGGARPEHPLRQVSQVSFDGARSPLPKFPPAGETSFSDPDFSNDGEPSLPVAVYNVLRALDHEPDALIDNTGINRVLERGRLVTLTRDYSTSFATSHEDTSNKDRAEPFKAATAPVEATRQSTARSHNTHGAEDSRPQPRYEEYEQYPSSPWAQSPAPSPAIQNDAEANPFFVAGGVDEETFNPSRSPQDYTQFGHVEAIGVDKASTVTHIPLIHPTLSQVMTSADYATPSQTPSLSRKNSELPSSIPSEKDEFVRKAPIAILSILSSIVPYPRNLTNSLKHLGPHLATSFSNAWQFTNAQAQVTSIRQRRITLEGNTFPGDQDSIDDLLHLDLDDITHSAAGSVTSPSDYSGRSRHSPGGSIAGTPGWDASSLGFSSKHSLGGTPGHLAGSDAVESYFDSRKKIGKNTGQPSSSAPEKTSNKPEKRQSIRVSLNAVAEQADDCTSAPRDSKASKEDVLSARRTPPSASQNRSHSLLHSYGADFSSSFQSLPAATATTPGGRPLGLHSHARKGSITENFEMPPPSESLLRTIIDSLPVQIFTAAPNTGAITWVNSKFLIYRGQDSRQVLQDPWEAIHPEDRTPYLHEWSKSLRTGQQFQKKVRMQRFDKCYRWFYVRVAPLKNKRQQIVHWIGTNMDFHEQHIAEQNSARQQETAASEAKYRALANSSPQIVFVVSNRRGLTFCNSQWITFSGQSESSALGNGFLEHVHPNDVIKCKLPILNEDGVANVPTTLPPEHVRADSDSSESSSEGDRTITSPGSSAPDRMDLPQAKLSKLASTGILSITKDADGRASYSTEVRLQNKDGDYRWHLVRILLENSLAEEGGEETWYGTATDINDHKLLEQTLKETMDAKSKFLSNMSHEIRTPLNGISGMVNFLLDSVLNPEQLEHVNIIKASTDSLLNLINDILDLSKVEAGMIKLSMEWLHVPSLLEEVNDLNMGLAIQKGLELNYLVEEGVPTMVKGDKFRIRQVLLNVVGNAIKFTNKGEIFVRCRLQPPERSGPLKDNEAMVRFEVVDTGQGFTEAEAKYLFKRFSQIDASSTRQHGGTGLGLAISMQFVELHGGKMDARSIPGKGSTFFFTIKFGLPTQEDFPKSQLSSSPGTPLMEPVTSALPHLPNSPHSSQGSALQKFIQSQASGMSSIRRVPSISSERNEPAKSPSASLSASEPPRESPSLSSGSSDHSLTSTVLTGKSSIRSERSSASSYLQEVRLPSEPSLHLALPAKRPEGEGEGAGHSSTSLNSETAIQPSSPHRSSSPLGSALQPPMYSILVICPLEHSREATIRHIKNTLPQGIPHQVTSQPNIIGAQRMIGGDNPVLFTHVVLVLHDTAEVYAIMDQIFSSMTYGNTSVIVVSDPSQKKELIKQAPVYDYEQLNVDRRLQFIYRPLKPSKFAIIFDPQKQRESSTDRNQDSAQQVVVSQKLVFEELKRRVGGKYHKVLLVEDNKINQTVILKFLAKIDIETETVQDGAQCTDAVFSKEPGHYSIILCDLHMPNKDGYQACKEIRRWEKKHGYRRHPIIALSANVLGDVYAKCVEAGFNSYVTKPVEFKELSLAMTKFLDPPDPSKQPEIMKRK